MLCDRSLSFFHSFCHSVNRISDERGNGRRPNLASTAKRWPSRSDWHLMVIRICAWIPDHFHFIHHWRIGDFQTFVSIFSVFSILIQSTVDLYHTWRNDWRRRDNASTISGRIRRTSRSRLIRKSEYESRITFVSNFGVGGDLHSLLQKEHMQLARYRTSDLTDFQNAVACNCKGYTSRVVFVGGGEAGDCPRHWFSSSTLMFWNVPSQPGKLNSPLLVYSRMTDSWYYGLSSIIMS